MQTGEVTASCGGLVVVLGRVGSGGKFKDVQRGQRSVKVNVVNVVNVVNGTSTFNQRSINVQSTFTVGLRSRTGSFLIGMGKPPGHALIAMSMNIHHLELFYYVARHGGISEAVRQMPYGIQQPAVSSQIIQLEESLGVTLFQRRPFQLLPAGESLYEFIKPFFDDIDSVAEKIRSGGKFEHLRIAAAEIILRDHLPAPLQSLKKKFPSLKVTLRSGYLPQIESWLLKREIDFAVTLLDGKAPSGLNTRPLIKLSLGLLLPKGSKIKSAEELWRSDRIEETLISLPARESISTTFQEGLVRVGAEWFPGIEVSSLDVVEAYVNNGYGIGLTVIVPNAPQPANGVRLLPLPDFPPVSIGALWPGKLTPTTKAFLDELEARAQQIAK